VFKDFTIKSIEDRIYESRSSSSEPPSPTPNLPPYWKNTVVKLYIATAPRLQAANPPHGNLQIHILYILYAPFCDSLSSVRSFDFTPWYIDPNASCSVRRYCGTFLYLHTYYILYILLYLSYIASNILLYF